MTRPTLLGYLHQATAETIGFFNRSLQWPSLSSVVHRRSDLGQPGQTDPPSHCVTDCQTGFVNRVLQTPIAAAASAPVSVIASSPPGVGTLGSAPSGTVVGPVRLSATPDSNKLQLEALKLLFPAMLVTSYVASTSTSVEQVVQLEPSVENKIDDPSLPTISTECEISTQNVTSCGGADTYGTDDSTDVEKTASSDEEGAPLHEALSALSLEKQNELKVAEQCSVKADSPSTVARDSSRTKKPDVSPSKHMENESDDSLFDPKVTTRASKDEASTEESIHVPINGSDCLEASKDADSTSQKDPLRCQHSTKHVNFSKCSSALKKKSCAVEADSLLCLQCGKPWSDDQSAETHSSRSNHPVMLDCKDGSLICFKCGKVDVSQSLAAQTEPTRTNMTNIRSMLGAKFPATEKVQKPGSKNIDLSSFAPIESTKTLGRPEEPQDVQQSNGAPYGLKNLGNTCFFNSSIQVLAQCTRVQEALKGNSGLGPLAQALGKCLRDVARKGGSSSTVSVERSGGKKNRDHSSSGGVISPAALFSAVCKVAPHFSGFEQQDAQELITFLLGGIEDEATPKHRVGSSADEEARRIPRFTNEGMQRKVRAQLRLNNGPFEHTNDWKLKHVGFWFGDERATGEIERTLPDEDEEPSSLRSVFVGDGENNDDDDDSFGNEDTVMSDGPDEQKQGGISEEEAEDETKHGEVVESKLGDVSSNSYQQKVKNLTKELFEIELESVVTCDDCDTQTVRKETQYMLSLALGATSPTTASNSAQPISVKGGKGKHKETHGKKSKTSSRDDGEIATISNGKDETLAACFERFFSQERLLVSDGNGFQCNKCANRKGQKAESALPHDATRRLRLGTLSDVLVLHFKRFQQVDRGGSKGVRAVKIETHVTLEDVLHFPAFGDYHLVGLVEHLGKSLHGGHYVAYVRPSPGVWFRCSDDIVSKVSEAHVFDSTQAYMAVYERR